MNDEDTMTQIAVASSRIQPRSGEGHIDFFLMEESNSWCRELFKTQEENIFSLSTF